MSAGKNKISFCLFPASAPAFPKIWGSTGVATSLLLSDLGCLLESLTLAKGLPSLTTSTVSKPRLSAVLLGEGKPCQRQSDSLDVVEKRGGKDEEKSLLRGCSQDHVVLN